MQFCKRFVVVLPTTNHILNFLIKDDEIRNDIAYCLAFSNDESDFSRNFAQLDDLMKGQLAHCHQQTKKRSIPPQSHHHLDTERLPKTWAEVDAINNSRAIVVTETQRPFRIVHVNRAWEKLCGYSFAEACGKSLKMLQGEETNVSSITSMLSPLFNENQESGAVLTNYTKDKRRFRNRIRVGCIYENESSETPSHFVGVLQEIHDGM